MFMMRNMINGEKQDSRRKSDGMHDDSKGGQFGVEWR